MSFTPYFVTTMYIVIRHYPSSLVFKNELIIFLIDTKKEKFYFVSWFWIIARMIHRINFQQKWLDRSHPDIMAEWCALYCFNCPKCNRMDWTFEVVFQFPQPLLHYKALLLEITKQKVALERIILAVKPTSN